MSEDIMTTVLNSAINFVSKIISPPLEELGLYLHDNIKLFRFNNQINILNKAEKACNENNISPKIVSPKLLCPLLDTASLEDDDYLQDK